MIEDLYNKYGIDTAPEGHKHSRPGWVNTACPFCKSDEDRYHLGFNTNGPYFYCFRCGKHGIEDSLMKILKVSLNQAKELADKYKLRRRVNSEYSFKPGLVKIKKKGFRYPTDTGPLLKPHKQYLEKRGFDPDYLVKHWDIKGTSPLSKLDGIDYRYRILAPIFWEGKVVSFQARDYTGKQELKYRVCPEEREVVHHKDILYGHPTLWEKRRGLLVEGIFDVWRMQFAACCCFGTGYTSEQIRVMTKMFDELFILFDPEPLAQKSAKSLADELGFWGVKAELVKLQKTDPGDMTQKQADLLLKSLNL